MKRAWLVPGLTVTVAFGCAIEALDYTGKACPCPAPFDSCVEGRCRREPAEPVAPVLDAANGDDGPPTTGYRPRYQARLRITNESATTEVGSGYPLCLVAKDAERFFGKVRSDLGDVRIVGPSSERPRIAELTRSVLSVCFRLERPIAAGATDEGYALRYGDPDASAPSTAPGEIFDFDEEFDGPDVGSRWTRAGAPAISDGALVLPKGLPSAAIGTFAASDGVPVDAELEMKVKVTNSSAASVLDGGSPLGYAFGFLGESELEPEVPSALFVGRSGRIRVEVARLTAPCAPLCFGTGWAQTIEWRIYRMRRHAGGVDVLFDDGASESIAGPVGDLALWIRNASTADLLVDWVRARPALVPGPVAAAEPEEVLP